MIESNILESSQRSVNINIIPYNHHNNINEVKYGRNRENKSVVIITKNIINSTDLKLSTAEVNSKINDKNNNDNASMEKSNRNTSSNNAQNINTPNNRKFEFLPLFNKNFLFSFRNNNNNRNNSIYNIDINERCLICEGELTKNEIENNYLECHHVICSDCYYMYLEEQINNNNVINIKCPKKDCDKILYNNFIEKMLVNHISLLNKYKKFVNRRQLILNPDIQLCPFPDCESYAKKGKNKYVTCIQNNHKFCFKCLKEWHGKKECTDIYDKNFENWKKLWKVKKCPKCKYFIEKNYGCNHITCFNCKYQFCWLCLKEYTDNHYQFGTCSGLQFSRYDCLSNKFFLYLRRITLVILKSLAFIIFFPFLLCFIIYAKIYILITDTTKDCFVLYGLTGVFACINFLAPLLSISSIIGILMILIWPLHDKVYDLICNDLIDDF